MLLFATAAMAFAANGEESWVTQQDVSFVLADTGEDAPPDNYTIGDEFAVYALIVNKSDMGIVPAGKMSFALPAGLELVSLETVNGSLEVLEPVDFACVIPGEFIMPAWMTIRVVEVVDKVDPEPGPGSGSSSPKTGDSTSPWMLITVLGLGIVAVAGGFLAKQKRRVQMIVGCFVVALVLTGATLAVGLESLSFEPVTVTHEVMVEGKLLPITATFTFENEVPVDGIYLQEGDDNVVVKVGETLWIEPFVSPINASNRMFTAVSSAPSVAYAASDANRFMRFNDYISGSYLPVAITGVEPGNAVVTLTTLDGGFTTTINVVVVSADNAVEGIELGVNEITIEEGEFFVFESFRVLPSWAIDMMGTLNPLDRRITAVSNDGTIADVEVGYDMWTGVPTCLYITGISEGTTTITITTADGGFIATLTVNVVASDNPVPIFPLSFDATDTVE